MKIGIFGSGSAALRYYKILRENNVEALLIRDDLSKITRNGLVYPVIRNSNLQTLDSVIIASRTDKRLKHIEMAIKANIKHFLIEKPIFTNLEEEEKLFHVKSIDYSFYTGDQYYYDDLLDQIPKELIIKEIEIIYSENINKVTKGRLDSYALNPNSGGAKWTFSHSLFVAVEYLKRSNIKKNFSDAFKNSLRDELNHFEVEYKFSNLKVRIKNIFHENDSASLFQMNIFNYQGVKFVYDFNDRCIICDGEVIYKSQLSRLDLIDRNVQGFLAKKYNDQFITSYEVSRLLGDKN